MLNKETRYLFLVAASLIWCSSSFSQSRKPNVVFIIVDDLRTTIGCYDDSIAITPNIDALAKSDTVFQNAYCQQAVCNASRASFMTGKRPNTIKVWDLKTHFRTGNPDIITLPQFFKQHGYHTQSVGKIYHDPADMQDAISWSVPETYAETTTLGKYVLDSNLNKKGNWKSASTERADRTESEYIDGMVSDAAIAIIDTIKDKPFFLAVGFRRPHLPFSAPENIGVYTTMLVSQSQTLLFSGYLESHLKMAWNSMDIQILVIAVVYRMPIHNCC